MARLGDIFKIQSGGTPDKKHPEYYTPSEIPWVKTGDLRGKYITSEIEFISKSGLKNSSAKVFPEGTVLIAMYGATIGACSILPFEASTNQACAAFLPNERALPEYLYYFLCSKKQQFTKDGVGGAQPNISAGYLSNVKVTLPSIPVQQKVAYTLTIVDELISLRKKQLKKLDDLVKSRFVEMFEQGAYEQVEFGDICEFLRNGANIKQTKGAAGYPITRIETLSNDVFNVDRLGYADIFDLGKYETYILREGDILISHINSVAYLGRAVQYRGQLNTPIIHGMNLLCARLIKDYNPTFIEFFFKSPMAKDYISTITKKAVNQASITTSDLKKMKVPSPSLAKQNEFDSFVRQVDKSKLTVQQGLDKLELLKQSLMQKYFG